MPSSLSGEPLSAVQTSGNATSVASGVITVPVLPPVLGPVDALTGQLTIEGKPGATVQIDVPAGSAISVVLDPQGKGSVILPSIASHESLVGTQMLGNLVSAPASIDIPVLAPRNGQVNDTGTSVTVNGKPGELIEVKDARGLELGSGSVGQDGSIEIALNAPQSSGGRLTLTAYDKGEASPAVTITAPVIDMERPLPPTEPPYDVSIEESGTQVTGKGNAGDRIRVKDARNNEIGSGVVKPDGTFVVNIPTQPADQTLAITAQGQGLESAPAYLQTPVLDTDRPPQPAVQIDAGGTRISGKTEPGARVSVKDAAGNLLAGPILAGEDGNFEAEIAKLPVGTPIKIVAEVAGKTSLPSELIVPLVDEATPPAPLSASISADGKSVFGEAAPNSQVVVKDAKGNVLGERTVNDDGSYVVPIAVQVGGTRLEVSSVSLDGESSSRPVSVLAPFQLAEQTHDAMVGLLTNPAITTITESEEVSFFTPLSTVVSNIANWFAGLADRDPLFPTSVTKEFSVGENERVEIKVSNKDSRLNADLGRNNYVLLERKVGDEWVKVQEKAGYGVGDILGVHVLSDVDETGLSLPFETPGDYRFTFTEFSVLGLGKKNYNLEIIREPFVEGFASNAITNDLVLPPGAKLLKVNDTELADEVQVVVQGKYGKLLIGTDGKASYVQDQNAAPSDQTETFTYEALLASGATQTSSFTITAKVASVSGDLLSQDDTYISSVDGTSLPARAEQTIKGQFGDLKIKADGEYTYIPKLDLAGLNDTDTFEYVVRHENGETVTSTLNVHITKAELVDEMDKVSTGSSSVADPTATETETETAVGADSLLRLVSDIAETPNKLVNLPEGDKSEPLPVRLEDILQPDGTISGPVSASVLDLPDSWQLFPESKATNDGKEYSYYMDPTTKQELWVESGVSVI
ncbi:TPA: hypothetical protein ONA52_005431 [Pseudomonas aeruginosa]|nr:hypothetical protein [Pseudomonas aeruginosa]